MDEKLWFDEVKKSLDEVVHGYPVSPVAYWAFIEDFSKKLDLKDKRIADLEILLKGSIIGG